VGDVPRGGDRAAVPGGAGRRAVDLSAAVVEPVAGGVAAAGGAAAGRLVVTRGGDEVGVRMPRSVWAAERGEGAAMVERWTGAATGGGASGRWKPRVEAEPKIM